MISMVILYKQLPLLDQALLENLASRAWGFEFESGDEARSYVAGESPLFVLRMDARSYAINHVDRPYFERVDQWDDLAMEHRAKHVIQNHAGWISIDLLGQRDESIDVAAEYERLGKLVDQLANEDTVAILFPELMRLIPWDEALKPMLTGDDPVANLGPIHPPVVTIADDDPEMLVAVRQARSRWHLFVTAFEDHARCELPPTVKEQFSIKAPVSVDNITEYIWVSVTAIENQIIYGRLANDPVSLNGRYQGDRVRVPVEQVNDWIYSDRGQRYGGFSVEILNELARQRSRLF
jgi:uncharacterized protein YegJ (DUF2314 family)